MKQATIFESMLITISVNGKDFLVSLVNGEMMNLNQLHVAAGKKKTQSPHEWLRLSQTEILIEKVCEQEHTDKSRMLKTSKKNVKYGGGTIAHWQLALAYAQYLSPEIHLQVNQVFKDHLEELIDPELAIKRGHQRATDAYLRRGKSPEWVATRLNGIQARNTFTNDLRDHGSGHNDYVEISNLENKAILGCTAQEFKAKNKLPASAKTRDHLARPDLASLKFLETMSSDKFDEENAQSGSDCKKIVSYVSKVVSDAKQKIIRRRILAA